MSVPGLNMAQQERRVEPMGTCSNTRKSVPILNSCCDSHFSCPVALEQVQIQWEHVQNIWILTKSAPKFYQINSNMDPLRLGPFTKSRPSNLLLFLHVFYNDFSHLYMGSGYDFVTGGLLQNQREKPLWRGSSPWYCKGNFKGDLKNMLSNCHHSLHPFILP